jgi:hypothetical protein
VLRQIGKGDQSICCPAVIVKRLQEVVGDEWRRRGPSSIVFEHHEPQGEEELVARPLRQLRDALGLGGSGFEHNQKQRAPIVLVNVDAIIGAAGNLRERVTDPAQEAAVPTGAQAIQKPTRPPWPNWPGTTKMPS